MAGITFPNEIAAGKTLLTLVACLVAAVALNAQTAQPPEGGGIQGRVADAMGLTVARASVTVCSGLRGASWNT